MPALGPHHRAGRELVARRDHDDLGAGGRERVDAQALAVERDRHRLEPGGARGVPVVGERRILEPDPAHAALGQHAEEQPVAWL